MSHAWIAFLSLPLGVKAIVAGCFAVVGTVLVVAGTVIVQDFPIMHDAHDEERREWIRNQQPRVR